MAFDREIVRFALSVVDVGFSDDIDCIVPCGLDVIQSFRMSFSKDCNGKSEGFLAAVSCGMHSKHL